MELLWVQFKERRAKNMKARYSEQYYRENWNSFIKKSSVNDYMNLEDDLQNELKIFDSNIAEKVRPIYAKKIHENAIEVLKKRMAMIQRLESGETSLGYTNKSQEVSEMHRIIQRFEFNCIQARDFKEKYLGA